VLAVNAERRSLEDIAMPLSAQAATRRPDPRAGPRKPGRPGGRVGSAGQGRSAAAGTAIDLDATERERTRG